MMDGRIIKLMCCRSYSLFLDSREMLRNFILYKIWRNMTNLAFVLTIQVMIQSEDVLLQLQGVRSREEHGLN